MAVVAVIRKYAIRKYATPISHTWRTCEIWLKQAECGPSKSASTPRLRYGALASGKAG